MSLFEHLEQKLDRVIKSATEHARFSQRLNEDLAAIESKVAGRIDAALISLAEQVDTRIKALKADLVGDLTGLSDEAAEAFDRTVGALSRNPATPAADRRIDPNTGLPADR